MNALGWPNYHFGSVSDRRESQKTTQSGPRIIAGGIVS